MRILIFSDMHGNRLGLDAVLDDVQGERFDATVCLGDAIQGGPQPSETADRLADLGCPVVMGNADDFLLTGDETGAEEITDERKMRLDTVRKWSLEQLTSAQKEFIRTFKPTITVPLSAERNLIGFHGSPHSYDDVILPQTPAEEVKKLLGEFEPHILAGGHTHVQQIHQFHRGFYIGVGSAGFAYRHDQDFAHMKLDPFAEYAVLTNDSGRIRVEFRRVQFDVDKLKDIYRRSGRPYAHESIEQYS